MTKVTRDEFLNAKSLLFASQLLDWTGQPVGPRLVQARQQEIRDESEMSECDMWVVWIQRRNMEECCCGTSKFPYGLRKPVDQRNSFWFENWDCSFHEQSSGHCPSLAYNHVYKHMTTGLLALWERTSSMGFASCCHRPNSSKEMKGSGSICSPDKNGSVFIGIALIM